MLGKIAGGAMVVAATSKIGYEKASKYQRRVKDIQAFSSGLWLLKSEMDFTMSVLSLALKTCGQLIPKSAARVFFLTANYIDSGFCCYDAFLKAMDEEKNNLSVENDEKQVLNDLFASLGSSDIETEKEKIENTIMRLKICESAAAENSRKYGRLCKICGVSAGLMIFTLLI